MKSDILEERNYDAIKNSIAYTLMGLVCTKALTLWMENPFTTAILGSAIAYHTYSNIKGSVEVYNKSKTTNDNKTAVLDSLENFTSKNLKNNLFLMTTVGGLELGRYLIALTYNSFDVETNTKLIMLSATTLVAVAGACYAYSMSKKSVNNCDYKKFDETPVTLVTTPKAEINDYGLHQRKTAKIA